MYLKGLILSGIILIASSFCLTGCSGKKAEPDFSRINAVCEMATLKCYYHNVAKAETEASGFLKWLDKGYKKIWIEYSGIVELGIDVNKMAISQPDEDGVVQITIPAAEILNVDLDDDTMSEPLTDTGFMTKITKEEETATLAEAQKHMEETVRANSTLLEQAQARAKNLIEGYVRNIGEQIGETYTVEWVNAE